MAVEHFLCNSDPAELIECCTVVARSKVGLSLAERLDYTVDSQPPLVPAHQTGSVGRFRLSVDLWEVAGQGAEPLSLAYMLWVTSVAVLVWPDESQQLVDAVVAEEARKIAEKMVY